MATAVSSLPSTSLGFTLLPGRSSTSTSPWGFFTSWAFSSTPTSALSTSFGAHPLPGRSFTSTSLGAPSLPKPSSTPASSPSTSFGVHPLPSRSSTSTSLGDLSVPGPSSTPASPWPLFLLGSSTSAYRGGPSYLASSSTSTSTGRRYHFIYPDLQNGGRPRDFVAGLDNIFRFFLLTAMWAGERAESNGQRRRRLHSWPSSCAAASALESFHV